MPLTPTAVLRHASTSHHTFCFKCQGSDRGPIMSRDQNLSNMDIHYNHDNKQKFQVWQF